MGSKWLEKLQASCEGLKADALFILVDQTGSNMSLVSSLNTFQPPLEWCFLFEGLPEEAMEEDAPLLIQLSLSRPLERLWLAGLLAAPVWQERILLLCSRWPFVKLAACLKQCVDAQWEGRGGILRFYDPRLFPLLMSTVLDERQRAYLLAPALFWSWQDRDGKLRMLPGEEKAPDGDESLKIDLSDAQIEKLLCVGDTNLFILHNGGTESYRLSEEQLFMRCYNAMLEANERGLIIDAQRDAHVAATLTPWRKVDGGVTQ
jgi:hypothetical protein